MAASLVYRNPVMTNNKTLIAAGNFVLLGWNLIGGGSAGYLKLFNASSIANVVFGSSVPVKTLFIPGTGTAVLSNESYIQNLFPLGIVAVVTGALADGDSSAPGNPCYVEIEYNTSQ